MQIFFLLSNCLLTVILKLQLTFYCPYFVSILYDIRGTSSLAGDLCFLRKWCANYYYKNVNFALEQPINSYKESRGIIALHFLQPQR